MTLDRGSRPKDGHASAPKPEPEVAPKPDPRNRKWQKNHPETPEIHVNPR